MRRAAGLLLALLLAVPVLLVSAVPAHACSCVKAGPTKYVKWADVVFTGTVEDSAADDTIRVARIAVDEVYKGSVRARTDVTTSAQGPACGVDLVPGSEVIVFGSLEGSSVATSTCAGSGTRLHERHPALGTGSPPEPGELVSDAWPGPVDRSIWWIGAPLLLLVAGAAAYAVRRRRANVGLRL